MGKTEQLDLLFHQLNVGDVVQRNNACDEILKMVDQTADPAEKDRLRQSIIYHLIDLGRVYEAEFIIEALHASANHDMQAASCFHRIEFCKKFARFVNEGNVLGFQDLFQKAQRDIGQNANAKIVFFDITMQVAVLLHTT